MTNEEMDAVEARAKVAAARVLGDHDYTSAEVLEEDVPALLSALRESRKRADAWRAQAATAAMDLVDARSQVEALTKALAPFVAHLPTEKDLDDLDDDTRSGRRRMGVGIGTVTFNEIRALLAALKPSAARWDGTCIHLGNSLNVHPWCPECRPSAAKETT
jgi:hypothetical protein